MRNRFVPTVATEHIPDIKSADSESTGAQQVLALWLHQKCQEQIRGLYVRFVDMTKAFDTLNRKEMWQIMKRVSWNSWIWSSRRRVWQVISNSDISEPFPTNNGMKLGFILFSLFSSAWCSNRPQKIWMIWTESTSNSVFMAFWSNRYETKHHFRILGAVEINTQTH